MPSYSCILCHITAPALDTDLHSPDVFPLMVSMLQSPSVMYVSHYCWLKLRVLAIATVVSSIDLTIVHAKTFCHPSYLRSIHLDYFLVKR